MKRSLENKKLVSWGFEDGKVGSESLESASKIRKSSYESKTPA
jgi:hypothetical protein